VSLEAPFIVQYLLRFSKAKYGFLRKVLFFIWKMFSVCGGDVFGGLQWCEF
jgi:hypothetical protein